MATYISPAPTFGTPFQSYEIVGPDVDAEIPSRRQHYNSYMGVSDTFHLTVTASVNFTSGDVAGKPAGARFGCGVLVVPDEDFDPSHWAIGNIGYAVSTVHRADAGNVTGVVELRNFALGAGRKYWVTIFPAWWVPTYPIPAPLDLAHITGSGRGLSFWTNRAPLAPVILTPDQDSTYNISDTFNLSWNINDPDQLGSDTPEEWDQRGWDLQYRSKPTPAAPNPTWYRLNGTDKDGFPTTSLTMHDTAWGEINRYWEHRDITIVCGDLSLPPHRLRLPAGAWQLRLRTFDNGVCFDSPGTPPVWPSLSAVPITNTSPWSNVLNVTILSPTNPPILLSPINDVSVDVDAGLALRWKFRDSRTPPGAQNKRSIRIRKGSGAWFNIAVDEASGSDVRAVTSGIYQIEAGFRYEWQVKVESTGGYDSDWSESGFFWGVPSPGSGGEVPIPGDTVELYELGCGSHSVGVYERGGLKRIADLTQLSRIKWDRRRDDISEAEIKISGWDEDCGRLLSNLRSWQHELVIFRDSGQGPVRVWEGPITHITYETDTVTIAARDVMCYVYRRILKVGFSDAYRASGGGLTTVTTRARKIIQDALAPSDPNVLAYLKTYEFDDDARQTRTVKPWSTTAFEVVDDMAAKSGLDYTTVGRRIILWDTHRQIGFLPEMRDGDFDASPIVTEYGMLLATVYGVTNGDGLYGYATKGYDPEAQTEPDYYSFVEMLVSTWTDGAEGDTGTLTFEAQQKMIEALTEQAERGIRSRWPTPVVVRVPDNSRLNPDVGVGINQLVPGVAIMLRSDTTLREVAQRQKLDRVDVVEESGVEQVRVTMSPFPTGDEDSDEAGEEG